MDSSTLAIAELYQLKGDLHYDGERVTQLAHAWQCGQLAKEDGASPQLQLAAWLHDIGHLLSKHAGSSTFFTGSIVSYDNRIKTEFLDVPTSILQTVGAVSKEAVEQMAVAIRTKMKTDYGISVSGIMGPSGQTNEKPLGMVWIGVANKEKVVSKVFYLRFDRQKNIEVTANQAINLLRLLIINKI